MALCVEIQPDGTLAQTGQPIEQCTGYVMVSGSEYSVLHFFEQAMAIPEPSVAGGWFVGALGTVLFWYVASRMAGAVVAIFK